MSKLHLYSVMAAMGFAAAAFAQVPPDTQPNPQPSTSETEGTAADRTPPGQTPTRQQGGSAMHQEGKEIVGAAVVSKTNAQLGKVVDVVFGETQQPEFVIISSDGKSVAMPYSAANSMMTTDKIVVDRAKLQSAPKLSENQWRKDSTGKWRLDAMRYWEK